MLGSSFNLPRPNGFIFASKNQGKRSSSSDEDNEVRKNQIWNIAKPNGFFFPSVPMPQSSKRVSEEYEEEEEASNLYNLLSSIFRVPDEEDEDATVMEKRDNFDDSTFFAGRGKRSNADLADAFFAGRGKKDVNADLAAFFAGRGKKGGDVGDIFFAGRG